MIFEIMATVISVAALVYFLKTENNKKAGTYAVIILAAAFLFRIATFWVIKGYETDISCFTGWADSAYKLGLSRFYAGAGFVDYPPGYIYVLYITGFIADVFNIDTASVLYNFLIKLPSMIADVLTAAIIYKFAKTKIAENKAAALCAIYAFNPFVYLTSALWGQVDSVFSLLIIIALIMLYNKKHIISACMYALALLVKPQALVIFPVYIFYIIYFVKNEGLKAVKTAVLSAISGAAVFFVLLIPFSVGRGFSWIFELYYNTLSSYPYATLNAPNFYGMIGANGMGIEDTFLGISYSVWSFGFILLICVLSAFVYFKNSGGVFASGNVLIAGMYILAAKMHERYIFPMFAILLILTAISKKKYPAVIGTVFSITTFAACAKVLVLSITGKNPWIGANELWFIIISAINVVIFIVMTYLMLKGERNGQ
ncbi:MAG: glycosyltransferase family 39 protein [Clostridia bacterium]|nr:glycosyltransferase family 39 protein [Clostridia bacterium]